MTRLNFIQSEAWPDNAPSKSQYKMGFQYELRGFTDEDWLETYVCIREYKQGKQGMLAGISSKSYSLMWRYEGSYGGRMPSAASAEEISSILRKDWDTYKGYFNANGKNLLNDTWHYWIREGYDAGFWQIREAIVLKTGKVDKYDVHWKEPRHNVLFVEYFGGIY